MKSALLLLFFISLNAYSFDGGISLPFGGKRKKDQINIKLSEFIISIDGRSDLIKAQIVPGSLKWQRDKQKVLEPHVLIRIKIYHDKSNVIISKNNESIIPEKRKKGYQTEVWTNLFASEVFKVYLGKELASSIQVESRVTNSPGKRKLIDYECSKFRLAIRGVGNEYFSVNCNMERVGSWGKEKPRLEVNWSMTNYRPLNGSRPPYTIYLTSPGPAQIILVNNKGVRKTLTFRALLPKRVHRLNTAFGIGPYSLHTDDLLKKKKESVAPSFMIYGNYNLTKQTSFRFFDALVINKSLFNNSGLYFAYQIADILDGKLEFVPLIGFQGLTYEYDKKSEKTNKIIAPQGFEVVLKDAFDIPNYKIIFGAFISTSSAYDYSNFWVRWGEKYFWEINWIDWRDSGQSARMLGLSVGLPLASFF